MMRTSRGSYDVAVVGGGPAGTVAAIAHAREGARVLILEADPRAARRFAGEWLHPTGVAVLDALRIGRLERAHARAGYGFVILPDDGSAPIEMPYTSGVALSAEHGAIVEALREVALDHAGIEMRTDARVSHVEGSLVRAEDRKTGATIEVRAGRVIGADGRTSTVRRSLGLPDASTVLSSMASVELRGVTLPHEGFGHVVLGGPGPALFYRISDDVVRGCLDVPIALGSGARTREVLWDGFAPVLPESLRAALRDALERGPVPWAINRFRPRTAFGRDETALIGDAVGHLHPMTAMGMTMGMLDARALAGARTIEEYGKARRGYIPELLSNALYHCFRREDASASEVRAAMFRTLRSDARERRRTMDILSGADGSRRSFGSAFLRIAAQAVGSTVTSTTDRSGLGAVPSALASFGEWMQWPAALVVPRVLDAKVRAKSSSTHPIPQLSPFVPTAAPVEASEDREAAKAPRVDDVTLADAIQRGSSVLLAELERIAMRFGTVPDAVLAGPALSCMRAITSTRMGVGMAARMTLGRRRLAVEGFPRLLESEPACVHLAELVLVLLDGASWQEIAPVALAEGVRALLDCQASHGGFAASRSAASRGEAELELTALACRAIDALARRYPDATDADLERVLERAASFVRARQRDDGAVSDARLDDVVATAFGLEALIAATGSPGDPAVRRAVRFLVGRARPEGFDAGVVASAHVLRAMVAASAPHDEVIGALARVLARELAGACSWEDARVMVEALAACEVRRAARPRRARSTSRAPSTSALPDALADDWAFCKESLGEVSRTFSRPIALLPPKLEVAVTLGYLLCRIADTVEDHVAVEASMRDELFALFLGALERGDDPATFASAFGLVPGDDAELTLARSLPRVMRVFAAQDAAVRASCVRWVAEMARGMSLYTHRPAGDDGIAALHTVSDLERYCFYVAGTVGHLLTDLFVHEMGVDPNGELGVLLRDRAEGFATGLQLTNILKDVTDDLARGVSFVPRNECARRGLPMASLLDPARRDAAHAAVAPLFELARARLDEALEYALTIPATHPEIRLFCLLPLWMAARTLVVARGSDAMFTPDTPVKISRAEVEARIAECVRLVTDDAALRARYEALYEPAREMNVVRA
jgi:phytoene/squalene synthetase/2-polyprenyl-6-methoxyphenol hydroxylase-like FAD-dependent oxidoreductase